MIYIPDPGGVFDSDVHRRTLGHLTPYVITLAGLYERMRPDIGTDFADEDELGEVLSDLEADGFASQAKGSWKQTNKGLGALNAPIPETED